MLVTKENEILTSQNNKVELFIAKNPSVKISSSALVIGVFHGDEPEGEYLINNLLNDIKESPCLLTSQAILFIPCLNPDGKALGVRENANGVDLNRDYPTKCRKSQHTDVQPETEFVIDILEKYSPDRVLAIHAPYGVVNYDGPAESLAEGMSRLNGYPVQVDIGYPTPGSFGTYAGKERNIPVITLELPETGQQEEFWLDNRKALHYFISA